MTIPAIASLVRLAPSRPANSEIHSRPSWWTSTVSSPVSAVTNTICSMGRDSGPGSIRWA